MTENTGTSTTTAESVPEGNVHAYTVTGMTCGHCVAAVTQALEQIGGIANVAVDLPTGALTFTSDEPVDPVVVRTAVNEAGYDVPPPDRP